MMEMEPHRNQGAEAGIRREDEISKYGFAEALKGKAEDLGFIAVGFSRPEKPFFYDEFRSWLGAGRHGDMAWLERHQELRKSPAYLLDGCRTVISLAFPYSSEKPRTPDGYTASRYTEGIKTDYHDRLKKFARSLTGSIIESYPESITRICVDSAPILERSFAFASGLGFIGKNNMLIIPGSGSYNFLVEILTTASFSFKQATPMENQCGSCTLCLDACPTGALEKPFLLNASKCLSYLTIEYKGAVDHGTARMMGRCFFGCDRCQEACPFNEDALSGKDLLPSTEQILGMDEKGFRQEFGKTVFARSGLEKLKSNIRAVRRDAATE